MVSFEKCDVHICLQPGSGLNCYKHTSVVYAWVTHAHVTCICIGRHYQTHLLCLSSDFLVAAVRQRGGFKTIAAKIGLSPQRLDKRGRKPKKPAMQESARLDEQIGTVPVKLLKAPGQQKTCRQPNGVCVQVEALEHESHELELV